ncbi:MAG: hypothetical protein QOE68_2574 [Thermoanaerobaculia bacterium]|jgi:hypothetical protein|nr:hypothetical protein [Thermoanaerobaculia bacterium]
MCSGFAAAIIWVMALTVIAGPYIVGSVRKSRA